MLRNILNTVRYTLAKGRYKSRYNLDKGEQLEREVFDVLHTRVKGYKKVLVDVLIPNGRGGTSQIDILIINRSGINVIECKNYNGRVDGGIEDNDWTVTYSNGKQYRFYNPILQNLGHIKSLENLLNNRYFNTVCRSIIVFSNTTVLKRGTFVSDIHNYNTVVDYLNSFSANIFKLNESYPVLDKVSINEIYNTLKVYSRSSRIAKKNHSDYVKGVQSKR